jgi:pimeloyl-ACP methyl ester carboxylesterase
VHIDCTGHGEPTLVFVHGGVCDGSDWDAQRREFSSKYRVVTFDLPGHGKSPYPSSAELSVESLALTAWEVTRRHGGEHVVLIGHSLGCFVVAEMLRQSVCGIAGLIFVDGILATVADQLRQSESAIGGSALRRGGHAESVGAGMLETTIEATNFHAIMRPYFERMFTNGSDVELRRHVLARLERMDGVFGRLLTLASQRWQTQLEVDESTFLRAVAVPTLVIQSASIDEYLNWHSMKPGMTTRWTELVTGRVRSAQLRIIPGVGHFPQIEAKDLFNSYVGEFVEQLHL